MIIPYEQLDEITLNNLIEQYILREGTDYGEIEYSLEQKANQILQQIKLKSIYIIYSELNESVTLISHEELKKMQLK
ncbi:YheU family protein [Psychromonas aquatilis]|uniref:YheU family protein n=1 Tax=Psychromonas aquatilis TaxID=2005072 RepID=A0ABU9GTV5_9GAMM